MNDAALEAIRNGASYPHIPEPLNEKSITFKLSISYILSGPWLDRYHLSPFF